MVKRFLFLLAAMGLLNGCDGDDPDPPPPPPPPPVAALHVLVVYESDHLDNMTPDQADILTNKTLRDWLAANCEDQDGQPAFRFLDKDADVSRLSQGWQDLFAEALEVRKDLEEKKPPEDDEPVSVLVVVSPKGKFAGPLPADAAAVLVLLTDYVGE